MGFRKTPLTYAHAAIRLAPQVSLSASRLNQASDVVMRTLPDLYAKRIARAKTLGIERWSLPADLVITVLKAAGGKHKQMTSTNKPTYVLRLHVNCHAAGVRQIGPAPRRPQPAFLQSTKTPRYRATTHIPGGFHAGMTVNPARRNRLIGPASRPGDARTTAIRKTLPATVYRDGIAQRPAETRPGFAAAQSMRLLRPPAPRRNPKAPYRADEKTHIIPTPATRPPRS